MEKEIRLLEDNFDQFTRKRMSDWILDNPELKPIDFVLEFFDEVKSLNDSPRNRQSVTKEDMSIVDDLIVGCLLTNQ